MSPINAVSFVPPSQKYLKFSVDANDEEQLEKENNLYMKYREMYTVDIIRTSGFVHHPSRETNSIVEGEIFKNEQDKIVESMRIMMAEFGVKKGIWHDLNHAFAQSDSIRAKRFRQMLS